MKNTKNQDSLQPKGKKQSFDIFFSSFEKSKETNQLWKKYVPIPKVIVSPDGRVRSSKYGNMDLKQSLSGNSGYLFIHVNIGKNKKKILPVHRLVASVYVPNPLKKPCVNHIDGNKLNNNFENLEWVTYSENLKHAYDHKLRLPNTVRNSGMFVKGVRGNPKSQIQRGAL